MREDTKQKRIKQRHKVCAFCFVEYCSIVKNGYRTPKNACCSEECRLKLGVKTRHENGSYVPTEQHIKNIRTAKIKKNPKYGQKTKELLKRKELLGLSGYDREKYSHWTQTPEGKKFLSEQHSGKSVSPGSRKKMSQSRKKLLKNRPERVYSSANGGKRKDLQERYFRSNWEANYARILNLFGVPWEYESESFELSDGSIYIPDFKVGDNFIELKGWLDDNSKRKLSLFKKDYPDIKLILICEKEYSFLRKKYKNLIENWEGK